MTPERDGPGAGAALVVGVGAASAADPAEIGRLIDDVLAEAGTGTALCVATAEGRAGGRTVQAAARDRGLALVAYPAGVLAQVEVPHPSRLVRERTGTASVAEAAALHAARALGGARLVVPKRRSARATAAVARIVPAGAGPGTGRDREPHGDGEDHRAEPGGAVPVRHPHPVEVRSYAILRSRVDLSPMPPLWRAVAERVIHATADLEYAVDLVTREEDLRQGWSALRSGAPIVTDEGMVAAGITARETLCHAADPAAARLARAAGIPRPAAAVRLAYAEVGPGAVWIVGSAPEAIGELIERRVRPALVIAVPAGFVGAAEAKRALRAAGLPQLSNVSEKGGSAVAAAAVNALLYFPADEPSPSDRPLPADRPALADEPPEDPS